ncbi:unnamed protein product, partial [Hymenolepis diminuta]
MEHEIYKNQYVMLEQYASNRSRNSDLPVQNEEDEIKSYDCGDNGLERTKLSTGLQDPENLDEYIFSLPNISIDMPEEGEEDENTPTETPTK